MGCGPALKLRVAKSKQDPRPPKPAYRCEGGAGLIRMEFGAQAGQWTPEGPSYLSGMEHGWLCVFMANVGPSKRLVNQSHSTFFLQPFEAVTVMPLQPDRVGRCLLTISRTFAADSGAFFTGLAAICGTFHRLAQHCRKSLIVKEDDAIQNSLKVQCQHTQNAPQ